jgi:hypothetical protein
MISCAMDKKVLDKRQLAIMLMDFASLEPALSVPSNQLT